VVIQCKERHFLPRPKGPGFPCRISDELEVYAGKLEIIRPRFWGRPRAVSAELCQKRAHRPGIMRPTAHRHRRRAGRAAPMIRNALARAQGMRGAVRWRVPPGNRALSHVRGAGLRAAYPRRRTTTGVRGRLGGGSALRRGQGPWRSCRDRPGPVVGNFEDIGGLVDGGADPAGIRAGRRGPHPPQATGSGSRPGLASNPSMGGERHQKKKSSSIPQMIGRASSFSGPGNSRSGFPACGELRATGIDAFRSTAFEGLFLRTRVSIRWRMGVALPEGIAASSIDISPRACADGKDIEARAPHARPAASMGATAFPGRAIGGVHAICATPWESWFSTPITGWERTRSSFRTSWDVSKTVFAICDRQDGCHRAGTRPCPARRGFDGFPRMGDADATRNSA